MENGGLPSGKRLHNYGHETEPAGVVLRRWAVLLLRRCGRCTRQESSGFVNEESLQITILKVTVTVNKNRDNSLTH